MVVGFIMITIAFGIIVIILIRATIRDYRRYLRFGPKYHILGMGRARERSQNSGQKWTSWSQPQTRSIHIPNDNQDRLVVRKWLTWLAWSWDLNLKCFTSIANLVCLVYWFYFLLFSFIFFLCIVVWLEFVWRVFFCNEFIVVIYSHNKDRMWGFDGIQNWIPVFFFFFLICFRDRIVFLFTLWMTKFNRVLNYDFD